MKKNMNELVLIAEIVAVISFHAVKIKQSEKHNQESIASRYVSKPGQSKQKADFMLMNMVK